MGRCRLESRGIGVMLGGALGCSDSDSESIITERKCSKDPSRVYASSRLVSGLQEGQYVAFLARQVGMRFRHAEPEKRFLFLIL